MPASSARSCSRLSRRSSGARRQRDEAGQRRAAEGIDADMVPARPVAPRDRLRARNTAPARPSRPRSNAQAAFTNGRSVGLLLRVDRRHQRADVERRVGQRRQHQCADTPAGCVGKIALQVHHHVVPPLRIELRQRGVHAVRAATAAPDRSAPPRRRRRAPHRRSRRRRRPPPPGRYPPRAPGPARARSSAGRGCRPAACPAAGWRPCGTGMTTIGFTWALRMG